MRWTTKDMRRVRKILDHVAKKTEGGHAGFATALRLNSRQVVNNWRRRGRVPLEHHTAVIEAAAPEMTVTPAMLDPVSRAATRNVVQSMKGAPSHV